MQVGSWDVTPAATQCPMGISPQLCASSSFPWGYQHDSTCPIQHLEMLEVVFSLLAIGSRSCGVTVGFEDRLWGGMSYSICTGCRTISHYVSPLLYALSNIFRYWDDVQHLEMLEVPP